MLDGLSILKRTTLLVLRHLTMPESEQPPQRALDELKALLTAWGAGLGAIAEQASAYVSRGESTDEVWARIARAAPAQAKRMQDSAEHMRDLLTFVSAHNSDLGSELQILASRSRGELEGFIALRPARGDDLAFFDAVQKDAVTLLESHDALIRLAP